MPETSASSGSSGGGSVVNRAHGHVRNHPEAVIAVLRAVHREDPRTFLVHPAAVRCKAHARHRLTVRRHRFGVSREIAHENYPVDHRRVLRDPCPWTPVVSRAACSSWLRSGRRSRAVTRRAAGSVTNRRQPEAAEESLRVPPSRASGLTALVSPESTPRQRRPKARAMRPSLGERSPECGRAWPVRGGATRTGRG